MTIFKSRKFIIITVCVLAAAALAAVGFVMLTKKGPVSKPPENNSAYKDFDFYVVAEDTPEDIINDLTANKVNFVKHVKNQSLYGGAGKVRLEGLKSGDKIYLCEGTYQTGSAGFMSFDGELDSVMVQGAGSGKVTVLGGVNNRPNSVDGFSLKADKDNPAENIKICDVTVSGYARAFSVDYGEGVTINDNVIKNNGFMGVNLRHAYKCEISGNEIRENGNTNGSDDGYGLSIMFDSRGNIGSGNKYINNAQNNIIDCVNRDGADYKTDNPIELEMSYDLHVDDSIDMKDVEGIKFELENGSYDGAVVMNEARTVNNFSGSGYVYLATGKITLNINIETAGNYRLYIASTSDDGYDKCEKVMINTTDEDDFIYVATPGYTGGSWVTTQPGMELWSSGVLTPNPKKDGIRLEKGRNTITIKAHWGYCFYDYILLKPM